MKKNNGWKWTLGFTIWFALSTVGALFSNMYDAYIRWPIPAGLTIAFGVVTFLLRSDAKKAEAAEEQRRKEQLRREEADRIAREKREAMRKAEQDRFRYESFPVAGVTFKNEDGTDRQKILREIALNNDGFAAVSFEENEDLGEDSGISVMTEFGCVGFIRRSDKANVRRFFGRQTQAIYLAVELFESDDGQKIYRADVQITMKRGDPDQQWYFDDLPES